MFQNFVLFFLASFVPRSISFFMLPLYTNCLTTEQYGNIDLIITLVQLLMPILTLQIQDAVLFFSMGKQENPAKVLSVGLWIVTCGFCLLLLGTTAVLMSGWIVLEWTYIAFFLAHYLISALTNVIGYFLRAIDSVKKITISAVITCVMTVGCNLLFLLVFHWGVIGYLLSNVLGHLVSLVYLCCSARINRYLVFRISDRAMIKRVVMFSLPMVVSALAWSINNSLDKYILTFYCGVSAAGLLGIAYKIPTIVSLLGATISKAFSVSAIQNFTKKDEDGFLGNSYGMISMFVVISASGLTILNVPIAQILFQKEFFTAWQLVPPLLFSAAMNQMSLCCENICVAMGRTKVLSGTAIIGAAVNIVLNICMIPTMGAYGAAIATAIGFAVVWLVRYIWVKKGMELKNNHAHEVASYGILLGQMILAYWGNRFVLFQLAGCAQLLFLYRKQIVKVFKLSLKRLIK